MSKHASHPDILKRLKRAEGHIRSVIAMIEAQKPCLDIAQQLHAVAGAIASAKAALIHDHIDHCLTHEAGGDAKAILSELKMLTKYL